uniref:Uncharacterized protein n=1 Tax=Nelumbo nucifera TaxID=4432 RepID=A0A822YB71_NELNU|nr:TPA_asm: hypothetical protein HUJ06_030017 [Nelumbo nucifera]
MMLIANFWPNVQCWVKVHMYKCSPVELRMILNRVGRLNGADRAAAVVGIECFLCHLGHVVRSTGEVEFCNK